MSTSEEAVAAKSDVVLVHALLLFQKRLAQQRNNPNTIITGNLMMIHIISHWDNDVEITLHYILISGSMDAYISAIVLFKHIKLQSDRL